MSRPHTMNEPYRPQFHFSPQAQWVNDPNGLVYFEGEYHLFYQYHPGSTIWGPMHWGHAISTDLVHWEHLPIALEPDHLGAIFSGSVVVDVNDTSSFFGGKAGLVAIFTHDNGQRPPDGPQVQSLAYSADRGRTWTKYDGNPALLNPDSPDFRDPKVFWHEATRRWVMILAVTNRVMLYTSPDLKSWTIASEFGVDQGYHRGVWECPDLFELNVDGDLHNAKWVMIVSTNGERGSQIQYFVGQFDGARFTNDNRADCVLWADYGADDYAAVSWSDISDVDGRRVWLGWMSNWQYARDVPTAPWRGAMTLPRTLALKMLPEGIRLVQEAVVELERLRKAEQHRVEEIVEPGVSPLSSMGGQCFELVVEFEVTDATEFGIHVRVGEGERTVIGYETATARLFVDRTKSGETGFHDVFAARHEAILPAVGNKIRLRLYVDRSSVEVFGNDGQVLITDLIFPQPESQGMALYSVGGRVRLVGLDFYPLRSIYVENDKSA